MSGVMRVPPSRITSAPTSGRERLDRRLAAEHRAEEHLRVPPSPCDDRRGVVGEGRLGVAVRGGQRHPELDPVQHGRVVGRHLGVGDAAPGRHQVQLAGLDQRMAADAVAVLDGATEQPAHGLQADVGVRRDDHAARLVHAVRPVVVEEAPGADQRALPLRAASGGRSWRAGRRAAPRGASRISVITLSGPGGGGSGSRVSGVRVHRGPAVLASPTVADVTAGPAPGVRRVLGRRAPPRRGRAAGRCRS